MANEKLFKINYDLYDQWLIVINHRLLTILNIINFSLKTTKRSFPLFGVFFGIFRIRGIYIVKVIAIAPQASWVGLNMQKRQLGYESSLIYLRKIRFIINTVHEALELWHSWPLRRVFRPSSGANIWPYIDDVLTLRNFFIYSSSG